MTTNHDLYVTVIIHQNCIDIYEKIFIQKAYSVWPCIAHTALP